MPDLSMNPFPLGLISTTIGAKANLIVNFPSYTDLVANWIQIQALDTNTKNIFVGKSDMNTTTMAGVLKILQPGETWSCPPNPGSMNRLIVSEFNIDVEVNAEGVIAACFVV